MSSLEGVGILVDGMQLARRTIVLGVNFPKIVCLCGSTKFWREYQKQMLRLTLEGYIYLSIGAATGTDDQHFGNMPVTEREELKAKLDELHKRKIDLADELLILNVSYPWCPKCEMFRHERDHTSCLVEKFELKPYIGESTRSEIEYALSKGKSVTYLNPVEDNKQYAPTKVD